MIETNLPMKKLTQDHLTQCEIYSLFIVCGLGS